MALLMHLNFVPQVSRMISLGKREMISHRAGDDQNRGEQLCWPGYANADWAKDCLLMHPFHWLALSIWLAMFTITDASLLFIPVIKWTSSSRKHFLQCEIVPIFLFSTSIESGSKHRTGS